MATSSDSTNPSHPQSQNDAAPKSAPKHTPLPWGYDGDGFDSIAATLCGTEGYSVFPVDHEGACNGPTICEIEDCCDDEEAEANAEFIVRACNSHYLLLEALANIVEFCDDPDGSEKSESLAGGLARILPSARAAIAKATGGAA